MFILLDTIIIMYVQYISMYVILYAYLRSWLSVRKQNIGARSPIATIYSYISNIPMRIK